MRQWVMGLLCVFAVSTGRAETTGTSGTSSGARAAGATGAAGMQELMSRIAPIWQKAQAVVSRNSAVCMRMKDQRFFIEWRTLGTSATAVLGVPEYYFGAPKALDDGRGFLVRAKPMTTQGASSWLIAFPFGQSPKVVAELPGATGGFTLAADGRSVVYEMGKPGGKGTLLVRLNLETQTTSALPIPGGAGLNPSFSPDGRTLAYIARRKIHQLDLKTGTIKSQGDDGILKEMPSWSPDGRYIVYQARTEPDPDGRGYDIYKLDTVTSKTVRLTQNTGNDVNPVFTGDGQDILFMSECGKGAGIGLAGPSMHIMKADGTDLRQDYVSRAMGGSVYFPSMASSAVVVSHYGLRSVPCEMDALAERASAAMSSATQGTVQRAPTGSSVTTVTFATLADGSTRKWVETVDSAGVRTAGLIAVAYSEEELLRALEGRRQTIDAVFAAGDRAFTLVRETTGVALVAIPPNGSGASAELLAELPHSAFSRPHVSKDRKRVVFRYVDQRQRQTLLVALEAGKGARVLARLPLTPDLDFERFDLDDAATQLVVAVKVDETVTLYRIALSAEATGPQPLLAADQGADYPAISPDGNEVAFVSAGMLRIRSLVGKEERVVVGDGAPKSWPTWSLDGKWIAYQALDDTGTAQGVRVVSAAGGKQNADVRTIGVSGADLLYPAFVSGGDGALWICSDEKSPGYPKLGVWRDKWEPVEASPRDVHFPR